MTKPAPLESIRLHFTEGSSDKVYEASIEPAGDGLYHVHFAYGRRGASLTTGIKTPDPVDEAKARKVYNKLVSDKTGKGYTPDGSGQAFAGTDKQGRDSGVRPMLLNAVDEAELSRLLAHGDFVLQEKYDGVRMLVRVDADGITGINRKGLTVALPEVVVAAVKVLPYLSELLLDGELLGDRYAPFDVLRFDGRDLTAQPYDQRLDLLERLLSNRPMSDSTLCVPYTYRTTDDKRRTLEQLREARAEGVVLKHRSAPYSPGRPNQGGDALKFKFTATATVEVLGLADGKRSAAIAVTENGALRPIGNVTIPANAALPTQGTLLEVEYLYCFPGGSLFQPVYKAVRTDLDAADAYDSLQFRRGTDDLAA